MLVLRVGVVLLLLLLHLGSADVRRNVDGKSLKICSVSGGLDIARLFSSSTRSFFSSAIDDVELIREYISEATVNGGIQGFHDMEAMLQTVDWKARNLTSGVAAKEKLGFVDDRVDRRVERFVSLVNEPLAGDKATDIAMIDSASNILPWIVDRKSVEGKWWLKDHQNGRSEGPTKEKFRFERLYVAAWIGTYGDAWLYYPPLRVYGHPMSFGDMMGATYNSHDEVFVKPNLPDNNQDRNAYFTKPYSDTAIPGLSLITAQAPIYFTGTWQNHTYFNTYVASCGVDISIEAVSTLLEELEGSLSDNSFAFIVDVTTFHMIVISQSTVEQIYPPRTGFEESRVVYDHHNGTIVSDRRNQTYLVSDTIFQAVVDLDNANWTSLQEKVARLLPGERSNSYLDIHLPGNETATAFHVMYERWSSIADWALVLFAPKGEVDNAINVTFTVNTIVLETIQSDGRPSLLDFELTVINSGTLSVRLSVRLIPGWIQLHLESVEDNALILAPNEERSLYFTASSQDLNLGATSSFITFSVQDDDFPDCYYDQELTATVTIRVNSEVELNQLHTIRAYGYTLAFLICVASAGWSLWTLRNSQHNVVRSAQPIFLHMMCLGTFFLGLSIIPLGIDDAVASQRGCDIACQSFAWLMALGFSIAFSALFSKIWRINQIFRASRHCQKVRITARHVVIPLLVILSLNMICLTTWTVVDPLKWVRSPVYESNGLLEHKSFGRCSLHGSTFSTVCMCLILTVNFAAMMMALIQLYQSFDAVGKFLEEAKMLAIAMASMMQVFLTGLPILVIVTNNPPLSFFVKTTTIFVVAMSLLLLTFCPMFRTAKSTPESAPPSVLSFAPRHSWDDCSLSRSGGVPSLAGASWHGQPITTTVAQAYKRSQNLSIRDRRNTFAEGMAESVRKLRLASDFKGIDESNSPSFDGHDLSRNSDDMIAAFEKSCATALVSNCRSKLSQSFTHSTTDLSVSHGALVSENGSASCEEGV